MSIGDSPSLSHQDPPSSLQALRDVAQAGKARYIGASLMYAWQFAKAQEAARPHDWTGFVSTQTRYNLVHREEERE